MSDKKKQNKLYIESFNFIAGTDAKALILGSMPGIASLDRQQYYAHPRNVFWPIIEHLFTATNQAAKQLPYEKRLQVLLKHKFALWDVLAKCQRQGSLDSNIDNNSIFLNDFESLFNYAPEIKTILFNGKTAEKLFRQHFLKKNNHLVKQIKLISLPSTSPAHAGMPFAEKLEHWRIIKNLAK